jgi:hypothetical protein
MNEMWTILLAAIGLVVVDMFTRPSDSSSVPKVLDLTALIAKRKR